MMRGTCFFALSRSCELTCVLFLCRVMSLKVLGDSRAARGSPEPPPPERAVQSLGADAHDLRTKVGPVCELCGQGEER